MNDTLWVGKPEKPGKKVIGYVEAVVRLPLIEGDKTDDGSWPWFIYEEPGVTSKGRLGVCRRECKTVSANVVLNE